MIHELKINEKYFSEVVKGRKKVEIRKNDRDFKVGDYLALNEIKNNDLPFPEYTGRSFMVKITHILEDETYLQPGYAALSIVKENFIN